MDQEDENRTHIEAVEETEFGRKPTDPEFQGPVVMAMMDPWAVKPSDPNQVRFWVYRMRSSLLATAYVTEEFHDDDPQQSDDWVRDKLRESFRKVLRETLEDDEKFERAYRFCTIYKARCAQTSEDEDDADDEEAETEAPADEDDND